MKKLLVFLAVLAVIAVVVTLGFGSAVNSAVKKGMETAGSEITGTSVSVATVDLSPFSGQGRVTELVIGNPQGFVTANACKVAEIKIDLDPRSVFSDVVVIHSLEIDGAEITYEINKRAQHNLIEIQKYIESQLGPADKSESETKLIIERFVMKNIKVRVRAPLMGKEGKALTLGDIEVRDIGKDSGGATGAAVADKILQPLTQAVFKAVSGEQGLLGKVKDDILKNLGGVDKLKVDDGVKTKFTNLLKKLPFFKQKGDDD